MARAVWRKSRRSGAGENCVEVARVRKAVWRKSRRSGADENCVEVARVRDVYAIRDSKNPSGPALAFTGAEWRTFLHTVKTEGVLHSCDHGWAAT